MNLKFTIFLIGVFLTFNSLGQHDSFNNFFSNIFENVPYSRSPDRILAYVQKDTISFQVDVSRQDSTNVIEWFDVNCFKIAQDSTKEYSSSFQYRKSTFILMSKKVNVVGSTLSTNYSFWSYVRAKWKYRKYKNQLKKHFHHCNSFTVFNFRSSTRFKETSFFLNKDDKYPAFSLSCRPPKCMSRALVIFDFNIAFTNGKEAKTDWNLEF